MALKKCKKHTRRSLLPQWRTFRDQLNILWESITLQCKYINEINSLKDFLSFRGGRKHCDIDISLDVINIPLTASFFQFLFFAQSLNHLRNTNCFTLMSRAVFRTQSNIYDGTFS